MGAERAAMAEAAELLRQLHEEDPWFLYPQAVDLLSALDATEVPALMAALDDPSARSARRWRERWGRMMRS